MTKKETFIGNLKAAGGIICVACESTGISRSTYYDWYNRDESFRRKVEEVMEAQIDYVESKLMNLINAGDTTATIFYLKSKGKNRGWNERLNQQPKPIIAQPVVIEAIPNKDDPKKIGFNDKIQEKKDYITDLLNKQGKYTPELAMQVDIAAQLLVRCDKIGEEINADGYKAINVEISREGNNRESINPKEKLYLDLLQQAQKALRALGMNTDSKERKAGEDGFGDFLQQFQDEEDQE